MLEQTPLHLAKIRFGVFEADLRAGELRKCGIRIKLQSQPFKLLTILLSRSGEIVTREELQQQLWGSETVVNFDHSLGTAINKVREALGDSAENPRYIETLAKRGYRFVAPVQVLEGTDSPVSTIAVDSAPAAISIPAIRAAAPNRAQSWLDMVPWRAVGPFLAGIVVIGFALRLWGPVDSAKPVILPFTQVTASDSIFPGDVGVERFPALLTDGSRIYFSKIESGRVALAYSAISGGAANPLVTPPEIGTPRLADISPDGSKLLVIGETLTELERTMWVVPSTGGAARKIVSGLGHDGTWLPDGNTIIYASGQNILITHNEGQNARVLTSVPGRAFWLRCAPDGSRFRFTVMDSATRATSLWEFTFAGNKLRPLLPEWTHPTAECCGNWTPDGKYFVFQSNRVEGSNIWMLPEKTWIGAAVSPPIQLTAGPLNFLGPVPARHGTRIFFTGAHRQSQLRRYDAATRRFIPYLREISMAGRTEFSRDGTRVAWISTSDGALWQSRLDGSQRLQLTARPMRVFMMRWSPDARSMVFMGKEPDKTWKIYSISTEGGQPQIVSEEARSQADPDWSPDGKMIVFGRSSEFMAEDSTPKSIQIVDLATRRVYTVTGSDGLFSPRWSPDGRYLVAMPLDQRKLMIFDIGSKKWSELATGTFNNPVWSKDGKHIYYQSYDEGNPICRIQVSNGRIEEITDFRDLQPGATVGYWGIGLEDAPIVSFHFLTADIYSVDWAHH
jgi:Tol biopolymer transport system component/DNA-binding winged helix-turn-helix (wHTH) protein